MKNSQTQAGGESREELCSHNGRIGIPWIPIHRLWRPDASQSEERRQVQAASSRVDASPRKHLDDDSFEGFRLLSSRLDRLLLFGPDQEFLRHIRQVGSSTHPVLLLEQWRKPSARIRNLMKLGLDRNDAVPFGSCSRGPWFMSRCESVQSTLTNSHLQQSGLVSLFEIWSKLAPKRENGTSNGPAC